MIFKPITILNSNSFNIFQNRHQSLDICIEGQKIGKKSKDNQNNQDFTNLLEYYDNCL